MIVSHSLQIRRGVRTRTMPQTAIEARKVDGECAGCGKSTLLALLKNEISAPMPGFTLPGTRLSVGESGNTCVYQPTVE